MSDRAYFGSEKAVSVLSDILSCICLSGEYKELKPVAGARGFINQTSWAAYVFDCTNFRFSQAPSLGCVCMILALYEQVA